MFKKNMYDIYLKRNRKQHFRIPGYRLTIIKLLFSRNDVIISNRIVFEITHLFIDETSKKFRMYLQITTVYLLNLNSDQ